LHNKNQVGVMPQFWGAAD